MSTETAGPTLATRANMRRYEQANPPRKVKQDNGGEATIMPVPLIALDLETGEEWAASAGDYWQHGDDEPLRNEAGEPLILVRKVTTYVDALNGEAI